HAAADTGRVVLRPGLQRGGILCACARGDAEPDDPYGKRHYVSEMHEKSPDDEMKGGSRAARAFHHRRKAPSHPWATGASSCRTFPIEAARVRQLSAAGGRCGREQPPT